MITNKQTLWLNYPDTYNKIWFTGCLHLWWPLLLCRAIANGFHPTTHKVSLQSSKVIILPKTKVSRYSHHLNQSALRETNWFFKVSRCNPYLNPFLIIYTTTPLWSLTKISWNYVYLMPHTCSHTIFHMLSHNIHIACQYSTNQPWFMIQFIPSSSITVHKIS